MKVTQYTPATIHRLPTQPGVYRFYNAAQKLIYVGKAKNIKKRVSSYFNRHQNSSLKTKKMVAEIKAIEFTIVNAEYEALLLENNLIKKNQPRYNILLRDDKTYPYICVTNERFPRIITTRRVIQRLGRYYGPFTNVKAMRQVLALIKSLYTLRTCTYNLSEENIRKGKFKVCLAYHIGNCQGPCEGLQDEEDYQKDTVQAEHILKGNLHKVKLFFKEKMHQAARSLAFEKAQAYKEKLEALEKYQAKSLIVNPKITDLDVFGIVSDEQAAFVSYLKIKNGMIIFTQTVEIKKKLNEEDNEILPLVIFNFREKYRSDAPEVLTNTPVALTLDAVKVTVPKIGDKKKLIELTIRNALFFKKERFQRKASYKERTNKPLILLQQDLQLKSLPLRIECFDNSNIQGSNPVASMVCFKNGKPAKSEYRHFTIKTVTGPDDFASMREVVLRRYKSLVDEDQDLPELIVIDGGKGQLSAAVQSLKKVGIYGKVAIIGIAKKLEEIYYPEDPYPIHINKKSPSLKLLQRIRDEAHRFAITFHRNKRSKASFQSQLEEIAGVGPKTISKLLQHFKSVKHIKEASIEALAEQVGTQKATLIKAYLVPSSEF
ncbi:MAG: excinuclease ABC subunit UvrC [Cytophagales bacterium]|nr:excinuclease ABC subunit UvrC [Cytophagales bacterium]